jgi:dTDP-4-amino-4,6-dideoxygalactose transaminase
MTAIPSEGASDFAVPRHNYAAQLPGLEDELMPRIAALLEEGGYVLGEQVWWFERRLARFLDTEHVVAVGSGTDALVLALDALDVGSSDEVITVANGFHATALAVYRVGAVPVYVDCRPGDFLVDMERVDAALTDRTAALLLVHAFGRAADLRAARDFCDRAGISLVEDCTQAIGARFAGQRVGTVGDAGCWSFAPARNLAAAGDGGAVSTQRSGIAERVRRLRDLGRTSKDQHVIRGYSSRLDSIQALVLDHKLAQVDDWNTRRIDAAAAYRHHLAGLPVTFQDAGRAGEHVYHLFQVRVPADDRDPLLDHLRLQGIDAVVRYPEPLHLQPALRDPKYPPGTFPVAEALARETLCLPIRPDLAEVEIDYVCSTVRSFYRGARHASRLA